MKQPHLEENLYEYLTGRLSPEETRRADGHCRQCERCRREAEAMKRTLVLLDQWAPHPLTAEYQRKVIGEIYDAPLPPKPIFRRIRQWFRIPAFRWSLEGAAVAVAILLTVTIYHNFTPQVKTEFRGGFEVEVEEVRTPVVVEVKNMDAALSRLKTLIEAHDGKLVSRRKVASGMEITIHIGKRAETIFLQKLSRLGKVRIEGNDYRDKEGNVVVRLKLS